MDIEDTLVELPEGDEETSNPIEKPKRKASEKQLAALAAAREKRKTKMTALDKAAAITTQVEEPVTVKKTIGKVVRLPEAEPQPIILKKPKLKRSAPKPTIIQFESDDSSSDDSEGGTPAPTIIIRNGKKKAEPKKQVESEKPAPPPLQPEPPRQYIRRAY